MADSGVKGQELDTETLFVQTVLRLGDKYGIKVNIDFDNYIVNFDGDGDCAGLARELEELFGNYAC